MHIARLAATDLADALANLEAATPHTLMTINVNEKAPEPFADIAAARQVYFEVTLVCTASWRPPRCRYRRSLMLCVSLP